MVTFHRPAFMLLSLSVIMLGLNARPAHALYLLDDCRFEEPTNGDLELGDDSYADVTDVLPAGSAFTFFGRQYGPGLRHIFVGSNGYIRFEQPLTDIPEEFHHICLGGGGQITPLGNDWNPEDSGAVRAEFRPWPDRLIVTWDAVPHYSNGGSNTFQAVLFLGTNKFHMSYKGVTETTGVVGICEPVDNSRNISAASLIVSGDGTYVGEDFFQPSNPFDLDGKCLRGSTSTTFGHTATILK